MTAQPNSSFELMSLIEDFEYFSSCSSRRCLDAVRRAHLNSGVSALRLWREKVLDPENQMPFNLGAEMGALKE